jgi:hypothetical protein
MKSSTRDPRVHRVDRLSRLPVGNQQLVGAFGVFGGGSFFRAFCLLL